MCQDQWKGVHAIMGENDDCTAFRLQQGGEEEDVPPPSQSVEQKMTPPMWSMELILYEEKK